MFKQMIAAAALLVLPAAAYAQQPAGGCAEVPGQGMTCSVPFTFQGGIELPPGQTVASLSANPCNAAARGQLRVVTDATTPTYNGALTGGGAVVVPVFCNGAAWVSH